MAFSVEDDILELRKAQLSISTQADTWYVHPSSSLRPETDSPPFHSKRNSSNQLRRDSPHRSPASVLSAAVQGSQK